MGTGEGGWKAVADREVASVACMGSSVLVNGQGDAAKRTALRVQREECSAKSAAKSAALRVQRRVQREECSEECCAEIIMH